MRTTALALSAFAAALVGSTCSVAAPLPCSSPEIRRDNGISLEEMVRRADSIVMATPYDFRLEDRGDGLAGVYTFTVTGALKGLGVADFEVPGMRPYDQLPQWYIDITVYHEAFDEAAVRLGGTFLSENEDSCVLAPQFLLGYEYLLFLGLNSFSGFEPVHSPPGDAWFQAVSAEVDRQRER
jgi:hypothetical protein